MSKYIIISGQIYDWRKQILQISKNIFYKAKRGEGRGIKGFIS
ncbi:MAG: hypothetical protein ACP5QK_10155 [Myxococcota bacterium]